VLVWDGKRAAVTATAAAPARHTRSWGLEGDFPYLWGPDDNSCEAHPLTRYVLGQVGLMGRVDQ
jgi:hypothetical protein